MANPDRGEISRAAIFFILPRTATDKTSCLGGRPVTPTEELAIGEALRREEQALEDERLAIRAANAAIPYLPKSPIETVKPH